MDFMIGDMVVHPAYGIGRIENKEEIEYMGQKAQPFYAISISNGTIWVPAGMDGGTKLRRLSDKEDLERCRAILRDAPQPLPDDRFQRKNQLAERMRPGTMDCFCEVLRDLTGRKSEKSLNEYDISALRKASEGVSREWAAVEGISVSAALREINALLAEAARRNVETPTNYSGYSM
jgi:RNA polymerase-interacting CarD/CdnL/TRCF family regulator